MGGVLALAAAGPGFSQINTSGFAPIQRATFNLAEAYPAISGSYTGSTPVTISPNGCWTAATGTPTVVTPTLAMRCNTTLQPDLFSAIPSFGQTLFAVAGVLCLPTAGDPMNPRLNVNAFAMLAPGDDPSQPLFVHRGGECRHTAGGDQPGAHEHHGHGGDPVHRERAGLLRPDGRLRPH